MILAARRQARASVMIAGFWMALVLVASPSGCARRDAGEPLLVAAAANLSVVLPRLTEAFEEATGIVVQTTTGASGQLAQQVREGAPLDNFLTADREWVERHADDGRIADGTFAVYARGRLVLFHSAAAPFQVSRVSDVMNPAVRRIAIANPETAPYGRAARQALEAAGVLALVKARIVIAENVRQTVQYVETAGADVAFTSEALMKHGQGVWTAVPSNLYEPLEQALGVVADRPNDGAAREFAAFVLGPRGREILGQSGFSLPDETR
jgi:molybdate transport system substrate-binding protein